MTAAGLENIRAIFKHPVVGVIEPGAQSAVEATNNKRVGVIGTKATVRSEAYTKVIQLLDKSITVVSTACPLFVPLVEEGWLTGPITDSIIRAYLTPLLTQRIDTLVLGCTHYPLLKKSIAAVVGSTVNLVDSAIATATVVRKILHENNLGASRPSSGPEYRFYVSDTVADFERIGKMFLGPKLSKAVKVSLQDI